MKTWISWLPQILLATGAWTALNGLLHTIAVIGSEHGKHYDRDLLRLLTDGLLLMLVGTVLILCYPGARNGNAQTVWTAFSAILTTLIYCCMIWPFLKSAGTMAIHLFAFVTVILWLIKK